MNVINQLKNPKVQQSVLEILFPFLGYFFWDWTLLIIVTFYFLDFLASQIMFTRRLAKIVNQYNESLKWVVPISIGVSFVFLATIAIVLYGFFVEHYLVDLNKSVNSELIQFSKEELWFLFPVILLSYYMMDKMFFFMPRRFKNYSVRPYLYKNMISNGIALLLIVLSIYFFSVTKPSDLITIIGIVSVKIVFDVVIKKYGLKID